MARVKQVIVLWGFRNRMSDDDLTGTAWLDKLRQMAQEHHDLAWDIPQIYQLKNLCRKQKKRIDELENWLKISKGLKCPACEDVGWYCGFGGEQEQCEFCYTCPDSIFARNRGESDECS